MNHTPNKSSDTPNVETHAEYQPLRAPAPLFEKSFALWTNEEANQFFRWVVINQEIRIGYLLKLLGKNIPQDFHEWEDFLLELGLRYADKLRSPQFSGHQKRGLELTGIGLALALDASLLVAHLLMRYPASTVHWELLCDPGAFSHNRPILKGFVHDLYLDPVGGVYEARGLLDGKKSPDLLKNVYAYWKSKMI